MTEGKFNVRIYGILENLEHQILISHETIQDNPAIKFPGGGLQFGEGTKDGLIREFKEETGMQIESIKHFYTTDIFQKSYFDPDEQIISIYYLVQSADTKDFDLRGKDETGHSFEWVDKNDIDPEQFTFPIDKIVVEKLMTQK